MKNTFGNSVSVTIFGESHGDMIGVVIDGLAPGITVDDDFIKEQLDKRRPKGKISTSRCEADEYKIVSGVFNGKTCGTSVCIMIPNTNTKSKDYEATRMLMRPSHADYTASCKYHGYEDYRGGGHFSGRITAALVAGGAIAIDILRKKNIYIGTHIKKLYDIEDRDFNDYKADIDKVNSMYYGILDDNIKDAMLKKAEEIADEGDSIGGVLETVICGMPEGVGEPYFDSVESILSHALFSVPAIKGIEFGKGFDICNYKGSQVNDEFYMDEGKVKTRTNNNGGINGGITNGMPVLFRCAVKPTPSIYKEQNTVDISKMEDAKLLINGRHDPAIVHRARVVVDSVTALAICDLLVTRYGTDYLL
ncbi:MAG: chorismate synthase [Lachnospiraceae bacterium]|nr:chorismate synthase [Lachnospiraceae bacterium]